MINLALIGLGNMGILHLKNIIKLEQQGLCKLTCICDIKKETTDKLEKELGVKGYYSTEEMLEENKFDAAIIATTSINHFEIAKILVENNKFLLIEKPVVVSLDEAEKLKKICQKKNMMISPGFTEVYNSVTTGIKNYLQNDTEFQYIDFFRVGQKSKRNNTKDIDVIQDLMTHDLAVLSELIDITKITNIFGNLTSYNEISKMYDLSNISLEFENKSIARFICDRTGTIKLRKFSISKENMYGNFDFMDQTAEIMKKGNIEAFGDNIWYSQNYDSVKIRYSNNPLMDEIKDFILSVEKQKETKVSERWFQITKVIENIRNTIYNTIY